MGPSENSHHNENNSNVSCKFPKAYCKPGVGETAPSHSRPYKGAIMSPFHRQGNRDPEKGSLIRVTLQLGGKASITSHVCQLGIHSPETGGS